MRNLFIYCLFVYLFLSLFVSLFILLRYNKPIISLALQVNFVPTTYSVKEGDAVELVAMLNIPADRDVSVEFTTMPGTASDG